MEKIFQSADITIKQRFRVHRTGITPMEPRGVLCDWNASDGLTAYITTQRPHIDRLALVDILDIPAEQVRVIAPRDQGGGFGVKAPFYRENIIIAYAARELKRPVRWIETRYESLMNVGQERDQINDMEVAASKDGKLLAVRNFGLADNGVGSTGVYWGFVMPFLGAVELPNAYTWEKGDVRLRVATTNKACLTPSRAFGHFPTRFALERAIDMVARRVGMEASELRRKNLVPSLPYTSVTNEYYDSGDFLKVWDNLMTRVDLAGFRAEQAAARAEGRYLGIGFGCGVELSGVASELLVPMENQPGYGAATVRLDPRGKVLVFGGDAPGGQGHETTTAQVVAAQFGIKPSDVVVTTGDTGDHAVRRGLDRRPRRLVFCQRGGRSLCRTEGQDHPHPGTRPADSRRACSTSSSRTARSSMWATKANASRSAKSSNASSCFRSICPKARSAGSIRRCFSKPLNP